jgi:hypothetical protein
MNEFIFLIGWSLSIDLLWISFDDGVLDLDKSSEKNSEANIGESAQAKVIFQIHWSMKSNLLNCGSVCSSLFIFLKQTKILKNQKNSFDLHDIP